VAVGRGKAQFQVGEALAPAKGCLTADVNEMGSTIGKSVYCDDINEDRTSLGRSHHAMGGAICHHANTHGKGLIPRFCGQIDIGTTERQNS